MFAKIEITGVLETETGLHIGGSDAFAAIGAVDSPVIRDTRTNMPMIPGSSLKGKMRALLAKEFNVGIKKPDDDDLRLTSLFGSAKKGDLHVSRILFSDLFLSNMDELRRAGINGATEVKFENSINRATAVANPRQLERVVRGAKFPLKLIYEMSENAGNADGDIVIRDFETLKEGFRLLHHDYLGGSGSRGYGRVKISELNVDVVVGEVDDMLIEKCKDILAD